MDISLIILLLLREVEGTDPSIPQQPPSGKMLISAAVMLKYKKIIFEKSRLYAIKFNNK